MCELYVSYAHKVDLSALRKALLSTEARWFYAERMEDVTLSWMPDLEEEQTWPQGWLEGRAFGTKVELDWWREGEQYQLRWLGATPPAQAQGITWKNGPTLQVIGPERQIVLRGELDESAADIHPTWSEARTTRPLSYPGAPAGEECPRRVALMVQDYGTDSRIRLTHLLCVVGHQEESR